MHAQERTEQFVHDLGMLVGTLIVVVTFRAFRRPRVPAYPLRCQHCTTLVRYSGQITTKWQGGRAVRTEPLYRDSTGRTYCPIGGGTISHKPMPSIR